ncbi:MAG: hypothetical protein IPI76_17385 [Chloracidobacterium sp.]|nr:hypothetical protein [Chloracidobacterium sp.]
MSPLSQVVLTSSVAGVLLLFFGVPFYVVFFLGAFSFLLLKIFTSGTGSDVRPIFEFYLLANDILRHDGKRWFGFEVAETIALGERITQLFEPPPLVIFTLGALYLRSGDNANASRCFESLYSETSGDEGAIIAPSDKLREYVKLLRKIEREPAEAPKISAAVRSLERMRKLRGPEMHKAALDMKGRSTVGDSVSAEVLTGDHFHERAKIRSVVENTDSDALHVRKSISEVLQDIYDEKVN